jgi:hypothetical protein
LLAGLLGRIPAPALISDICNFIQLVRVCKPIQVKSQNGCDEVVIVDFQVRPPSSGQRLDCARRQPSREWLIAGEYQG